MEYYIRCTPAGPVGVLNVPAAISQAAHGQDYTLLDCGDSACHALQLPAGCVKGLHGGSRQAANPQQQHSLLHVFWSWKPVAVHYSRVGAWPQLDWCSTMMHTKRLCCCRAQCALPAPPLHVTVKPHPTAPFMHATVKLQPCCVGATTNKPKPCQRIAGSVWIRQDDLLTERASQDTFHVEAGVRNRAVCCGVWHGQDKEAIKPTGTCVEADLVTVSVVGLWCRGLLHQPLEVWRGVVLMGTHVPHSCVSPEAVPLAEQFLLCRVLLQKLRNNRCETKVHITRLCQHVLCTVLLWIAPTTEPYTRVYCPSSPLLARYWSKNSIICRLMKAQQEVLRVLQLSSREQSITGHWTCAAMGEGRTL